jgi:hypothetical protein
VHKTGEEPSEGIEKSSATIAKARDVKLMTKQVRPVLLKPDQLKGSQEAVCLIEVKARGSFHQGREVANNFRIQAGYMAAILTAVLNSIRKICLAYREASIYELGCSKQAFAKISTLFYAFLS